MPLGLDGLGAAILNRSPASFFVKIANVANPANVANGVYRQVAAERLPKALPLFPTNTDLTY
jgi:hypothetical protein